MYPRNAQAITRKTAAAADNYQRSNLISRGEKVAVIRLENEENINVSVTGILFRISRSWTRLTRPWPIKKETGTNRTFQP